MKLLPILTLTAALLLLGSPTPLFAGKAKATATAGTKAERKVDPAKRAARKAARQTLAKYDKNSDGAITGDESVELRKAFDADKTGPLKSFDLNADGTLDDNEVAAIHRPKHGKGGKGGKRKKNAV